MTIRTDKEARSCAGCSYLTTFKPRPDEQERYGFGDEGHGCNSPGWKGYIVGLKPVCVHGPYLRTQSTLEGDR